MLTDNSTKTSTPMFGGETNILPILKTQEKELKAKLPPILGNKITSPSKVFNDYLTTGDSKLKDKVTRSLNILNEAATKGATQFLFGEESPTITQGATNYLRKTKDLFDKNVEKVKKGVDTISNKLSIFTGEPVTSEEYHKEILGVASNFLTKAPHKSLEGSWKGTNYDPYDRRQNRPDATSNNLGEGAVAGIKIDDSMVAVPRQEDGETGMLRLGTVIYVPSLDKKFLVADLKSPKYNGQRHIDFATTGTSTQIHPEYNQDFSDIVILREGKGRPDVREYVQSGEWEKEKNKPMK